MKRITITLFVVLASFISFSQGDDLKILWGKAYKKNLTIKCQSSAVTLIESEMALVTNVVFKTPVQLAREIREGAEKKLEDTSVTNDRTRSALSHGGEIEIYIERNSIAEANFAQFNWIIKDTSGAEIEKGTFLPSTPTRKEGSKKSAWYNYSASEIKGKVPQTFYLYIVCEESATNNRATAKYKIEGF